MIHPSEIFPLHEASNYLVPSQSTPGKFYVVTLMGEAGAACCGVDSSPCEGFRHRTRCAHVEAARAFRAVNSPVERLPYAARRDCAPLSTDSVARSGGAETTALEVGA